MSQPCKRRRLVCPDKKTATCPICQESCKEEVVISQLRGLSVDKACQHAFCKHCLLEWFKISSTCPTCRSEVYRVSDSASKVVVKTLKKIKKQEPPEPEEWEQQFDDMWEHYCAEYTDLNDGREQDDMQGYGDDGFVVADDEVDEEEEEEGEEEEEDEDDDEEVNDSL